MMNKEFDVIGLGISTIDFINIIDRFPGHEEVQKASQSVLEGGGPVSTAIISLARLGAKTAMIDSIGDDWIGNLILEGYNKENVNTDFIKINKGCTSSLASILVRKKDGARTIIYSPGSSPDLTENDMDYKFISKAKYLHINGRHLNFSLAASNFAKKNDTKISFDGGSHRYREELNDLIPFTDVCIVTKDFAEKYSNKKKMQDAAKFIIEKGPEIIVITDGINGSWLFTNEIRGFHQSAFLIENVVDTTGCGDCYHGAFLYGLCMNFNLYKTIEFASAAAALNAKSIGGRKGLPVETEVFEFLSK